MKASFYRRARLVLLLGLCAAWLATPLIAEICAAMPAECHHPMPCCPPGSSQRQCSTALCPAQVSQKAKPAQTIGDRTHIRPQFVPRDAQLAERSGPLWELTAGLHYSPPVFRLKDDLRI